MVKLSKLMMRQYKDGVYRMSRATVAKHVAQLEAENAALKQQIELEAIVSGLVQDENAAIKRIYRHIQAADHPNLKLPVAMSIAMAEMTALLTAEESE